EVVGDSVIVEGIRGRGRFGITAHALDLLGCTAPLPHADQPESGDSPGYETIELLVWNLIQPVDVRAVSAGELIEPDVDALGVQNHARVPLAVGSEGLRLPLERLEVVDACRR